MSLKKEAALTMLHLYRLVCDDLDKSAGHQNLSSKINARDSWQIGKRTVLQNFLLSFQITATGPNAFVMNAGMVILHFGVNNTWFSKHLTLQNLISS